MKEKMLFILTLVWSGLSVYYAINKDPFQEAIYLIAANITLVGAFLVGGKKE